VTANRDRSPASGRLATKGAGAALGLVLLTSLLPVPCSAQDGWVLLLGAENPPSPVVDNAGIGAWAGASDNYDTLDRLMRWEWIPRMNVAIHHSAAEGWLGEPGFYWADFREPLATEKTWASIYLWWRPGAAAYNYTLYFVPDIPPPGYYRFTLYLDQVPAGVSYNGPWQWELSATARTDIPAGTFAPFESETGLDSYRFHLTVAVPEPSGLVVLAGGVAVLALRRKRR